MEIKINILAILLIFSTILNSQNLKYKDIFENILEIQNANGNLKTCDLYASTYKDCIVVLIDSLFGFVGDLNSETLIIKVVSEDEFLIHVPSTCEWSVFYLQSLKKNKLEIKWVLFTNAIIYQTSEGHMFQTSVKQTEIYRFKNIRKKGWIEK